VRIRVEYARPIPLILATIWLCALLAGARCAADQRGQEAPPQRDQTEGALDTEKPEERIREEIKVVAPPIVEGDRLTPFGTQVSSVSSRQVDDLNAGDVASALRRMPGVTISRYNLVGGYGGGDGGAVYVRGQGSGRPGAEISTTIDGVPRFVGVWTHPLLDTLPSDMADRIDVYKSAQPVLFGNRSFAAIDLVPKRAVGQRMFTRVLGSFGQYSTVGGLVENGAKLGDLDYYVLASHRASNGQRQNADGMVNTLYGRLGYVVAEGWDLSVQVHSNNAWADDPGTLGTPQPPQPPRFAVKDTLSIATLADEHGNRSGYLKLFYDSGNIDWRQWDTATTQYFTTLTDFKSYGLRAQERFRLAGKTELVVGYDNDNYGGSTTEERVSRSSVFPQLLLRDDGLYAMVSRTFGSDVALTPSLGVRYTYSRDFGGNWGGQAGFVVRRGRTEIHLNYARAFNLPGVYAAVMYGQWGRGDAWKDLRPEILNHTEIGIGQQVAPALRLEATAFYDQVTNALRFVPPPPPPPSFANIGDYTEQGAEAKITFAPSPGVALFAGATYLDPTPTDVPNSPRWSLVAGVSWAPGESLRVNTDAEWVDAQAVLNPRFSSTQAWIASYFLLNCRASYRVRIVSSLASELFVAVENLTNTAYEYRLGYPMAGRMLSGGLDLRF